MLPVLMLISSPSKLRENKPDQADSRFSGEHISSMQLLAILRVADVDDRGFPQHSTVRKE
jgi:hypothetical protein